MHRIGAGRACLRAACLVAVLLLVPMGGRASEPVSLTLTGRLRLTGSSTLADWVCRTTDVEADPLHLVWPVDDRALRVFLDARADTLRQPVLRFPVDAIRCEEGERQNRHLRRALRANRYPDVVFRVRSITPRDTADSPPGPLRTTIAGELTITDTTRRVEISAELRVDGGDSPAIRVMGRTRLNMRQYGVSPPTLMWGMLTVDERARIHADFTLRPSPGR